MFTKILIKISYYALQWGGIKFLTPEQVAFIDQWEVENYRRKVSAATSAGSNLKNKIAIVTGGAQGFGAGIAESLYGLDVNVIIADLNEETGQSFVKEFIFKKITGKGDFRQGGCLGCGIGKKSCFQAVQEFGGLDLMVSNAGILKAGGLDEMDPDTFSKTTDVNYNGYFLCAKYAAEVMKLQNQGNPEYFYGYYSDKFKIGTKGQQQELCLCRCQIRRNRTYSIICS